MDRSESRSRRYSLEVALESISLLLERLLKDLVVFGAEFVVVFLFEVWPFTLSLLLHLLFSKVAEFFSHLASLDELPHSVKVFFLHVLGICWVLSLEEESKQLQHGLLNTKVWILESVLTDFSETSCDNGAKSLLHEGSGFLTAQQGVHLDWILMRWHLDWELSFVVSTWCLDELLKFVFGFE